MLQACMSETLDLTIGHRLHTVNLLVGENILLFLLFCVIPRNMVLFGQPSLFPNDPNHI